MWDKIELSDKRDSIIFFKLESGISVCESFIKKGGSKIREDKIKN